MKKIILVMVILTCLIMPLKSEIVFHVGGGYNLGFNFNDMAFTKSRDNLVSGTTVNIVSYVENHESLFTGGSSFGFNGGLTFYFNYSFGVGIDMGFYKPSYDIDQSYAWNWTWWDGTKNSTSKDWSGNSGSLTVIPINISLKYRYNLTDSFKIIVSAGATYFLC